jgi:hypothetical protein
MALNWLQKICQSFPPTYVGVGHGYRWDEGNKKHVELWQSGDTKPVLLWFWEKGIIYEDVRTKNNTAHWLLDIPAQGRIETGTNMGSVSFETDDTKLKKRILNDLVSKYPGVRFGVYGVEINPIPLQQYWTMLEEGQA